jgi:glycosyltransferase involved in cell wall biosynthesis
MSKKILYIINSSKFLHSHRLEVVQSARDIGYVIHVASDDENTKINCVKWHLVYPTRSGINPLLDLIYSFRILRLAYRIKPDIMHCITIKPVLYGGIIARIIKVQSVILSISGLGYAFSGSNKLVLSIVKALYKIAIGNKNATFIFQNESDFRILNSLGQVPSHIFTNGSGVNTEVYKPGIKKSGVIRVTFASRLLKSKGILDFVQLAREALIIGRNDIIFSIAGAIDNHNPESITEIELEAICAETNIEYHGSLQSTEHLLGMTDVFVFPSRYGEGIPKVLLEAMSCGVPVVTTDNPGCRDVVIEGITGFVVPIGDTMMLNKKVFRNN